MLKEVNRGVDSLCFPFTDLPPCRQLSRNNAVIAVGLGRFTLILLGCWELLNIWKDPDIEQEKEWRKTREKRHEKEINHRH